MSVYGTVTLTSNYEVFLGSPFRVSLWARPSYSHLGVNGPADLPANPSYLLKPPSVRWLTFHRCVTPSLKQSKGGTGIFNPFSITYAFRPRLRSRLTLRRRTLLRKPWTFGEPDSHGLYRYLCRHPHFCNLQKTSQSPFAGLQNASLPIPHYAESRSFGGMLSPKNYRRKTT